MSGIVNSDSVKTTVGKRLRQAREGKGYKRQQLCEKLQQSAHAPETKELNQSTLKQWELGTNAINIEWIPAICDVLDVDAGYLFGEHREKTYINCDIHEKTGLNEDAIALLCAWNEYEPHFPVLLSRLICSNYFIVLLRAVGVYIGEIKSDHGSKNFESIAEDFVANVTDYFLDENEENTIAKITKETLIKQVICDCLWKSIKTMTD